jgi:hypothetical protein
MSLGWGAEQQWGHCCFCSAHSAFVSWFSFRFYLSAIMASNTSVWDIENGVSDEWRGDNSCVSVSGLGRMSSLTPPLSTLLILVSAVHFGPCFHHSVRRTLEPKDWVGPMWDPRLQCILKCQSLMVVTFRVKGSADLRTQNHSMSPPSLQTEHEPYRQWLKGGQNQGAHVDRDIGEGGGQRRSPRCLLVLEGSLEIQKDVRSESTQTAAHRSRYRGHWL